MVRIVVLEPFRDLVVVWVLGVGQRFELVVESVDAAAVFRRSNLLAADITRIGDVRLAGADPADGQAMLPAIAKVVEIVDARLAGPEDVAQTRLGGVASRLGAPNAIPGR